MAGVPTSQVSVEVLQPPDFSHQPLPQCLLQVFPLTAALHQRLISLRNTLDLLLQLKRGKKRRGDGGKILESERSREKQKVEKEEFSVNLLHMPGRSWNVDLCFYSA